MFWEDVDDEALKIDVTAKVWKGKTMKTMQDDDEEEIEESKVVMILHAEDVNCIGK